MEGILKVKLLNIGRKSFLESDEFNRDISTHKNRKRESEEKIYVHYGSQHFDRNKFKEVKNMVFNTKPQYGLWGSYINSEYGWKQWCKDNDYELNEDDCFYFRIDGFQVYEIENENDLANLPHQQDIGKDFLNNTIHYLDFEKILNNDFPYFALDITMKDVNDYLLNYECDCILVLNDECLIENYDAKISNHPLTLNQLLPLRYYKTILKDIDVCYLRKMPDEKMYVYCEQPSEHYFLKSLVACISDGRIVEVCGYTEKEANLIIEEILKDKDELERRIIENRVYEEE